LSSGFTRHHDFKLFAFAKLRQRVATFGPAYDEKCGLAFTQGLSGAVIGVMVAVALVPPLVVSGMLLGDGHFTSAGGAWMLTMANVICINLAGIATFLHREFDREVGGKQNEQKRRRGEPSSCGLSCSRS
jgi:hypothetical protein